MAVCRVFSQSRHTVTRRPSIGECCLTRWRHASQGRDDLLQNIHRKTSSSFKGSKRTGAGKVTPTVGSQGQGQGQKEFRHMQQVGLS